METNIVEIDGKIYLEIPCRPETVLYTVYPYIYVDGPSDGARFPLKVSYKVSKLYPASLDEILNNMHRIGKDLFLTEIEAEEFKRKVELGICEL